VAYVWVLPGLHLPFVFGVCLSETLIFYIQHGCLGTECLGEFVMLS